MDPTPIGLVSFKDAIRTHTEGKPMMIWVENSHLQSQRRASEANILILDFLPPEQRGNKFLLFKPPVCGTLLWQPEQTYTDSLEE